MHPAPSDTPTASVSHEDLLSRVGKKRDRDAFITLFRYFAPRLKSWLMGKGASDSTAEEIVQNTMTSVWEKAKSYDPSRAAASTWIFTIARNKQIDALRRVKYPELDIDDPAVAATIEQMPAEEPFASPAVYQRLKSAVASLPDEQARLLKMAYFENKSHQDIARENRLPLGTVKSRLRLALDKLRSAMNGKEALP